MADTATAAQIESVCGAHCAGRILLLGDRLPPLPDAERFWGSRVLVPLGCRPEPALPESALVEALGLQVGEIAVHDGTRIDVLPGDALQPLTRAGIRLAGAEGRPT